MGGPQWTDDDFQRARTEAARLLGFTNAESLSAADNLKVDLVTSLRAVVDDASASVLEGTQTDLGKLVVAVEHLTKLLPQNQEPASRGADPRAAMLATYKAMRARGALHGEGYDGKVRRIAELEAEIERLKAGAAPDEGNNFRSNGSSSSATPADNVVPLRTSERSEVSPSPPAAPPVVDLASSRANNAGGSSGFSINGSPGGTEPWRPYTHLFE